MVEVKCIYKSAMIFIFMILNNRHIKNRERRSRFLCVDHKAKIQILLNIIHIHLMKIEYHYKIDPYKAIVQKQSMIFAVGVDLSLGDDGSKRVLCNDYLHKSSSSFLVNFLYLLFEYMDSVVSGILFINFSISILS